MRENGTPDTHKNGALAPGQMREKRATRGHLERRCCVIHCGPTAIQDSPMLAPKDLLDTLSGHASRLLSGETPLPRNEIESQLKALLQSGFSKLDLVSREEFDSQMVVLARTRARLESLEAKVAELEARLNPAAQ